VTLALHLLERENDPGEVSLSIDNQAVIRATDVRQAKPGQFLIDRIIDMAETIKERSGDDYKLTIRWIPGHSNVKGNEIMDKGAKKAAEGQVSAERRLPCFLAGQDLPSSISATRQHYTRKLHKQWKHCWSKS
jgi:ribonuclease HI